MVAVTICPFAVILEPKKINYATVSIFPLSICHEVMGLDAMIFIFWILSFKPNFSLSSVTFNKRLFSSSLLSDTEAVLYTYLKLLIFLPAILILVCHSSSPFRITHSAFKLNNQGDNIQLWCTPFPIWNHSIAPCPVLTVASWPVYSFLRRQVKWSSVPISFRIFHSLLWSTQSKTSVNKAEVDVFLESPCFFYNPMGVGNLIFS